MIHIGIDLHKKNLSLYGLDDQTGEIVATKIDTNSKKVMDFFNGWKGEKKVAVEATLNWYWLVDLLQENKIEVILSNPLQTKAIASARIKNDKVDARTLSYLLQADLLPRCWISDPESRARRELLRYRMKIVKMRTQVKNNVRAILCKKNIKLPIENIWGENGLKYLLGIKWTEPHKTIIAQSLEQVKMLDRQIEELNDKISTSCRKSKEAELLTTIPGIGDILAMTILAETGPIDRFRKSRNYVAYSGLCPNTRGSAGKVYKGHLSREANLYLRWAFTEAATGAVRGKNIFKSVFNRYENKKNKSTAKINVARRICKMTYHMLKNNWNFETYVKKQQNETATAVKVDLKKQGV